MYIYRVTIVSGDISKEDHRDGCDEKVASAEEHDGVDCHGPKFHSLLPVHPQHHPGSHHPASSCYCVYNLCVRMQKVVRLSGLCYGYSSKFNNILGLCKIHVKLMDFEHL